MIIKLKNNETINITSAPQSASTFTAVYTGLAELESDIQKLTKENLEQYQYESDEGQVFGIYPEAGQTPVELDGITLKVIDTGYTATFHLKPRDMVSERLKALEEGQELQDGAIMDIAEVVGGDAT